MKISSNPKLRRDWPRLNFVLSLTLALSLLTPLVPASLGSGDGNARRLATSSSPARESSDLRSAARASALLIPSISATKTDSFPDTDMDGLAGPGETITYNVTITNSGSMDATNVQFTDTIDSNTTLVGGSLMTTPIARNDSYSAAGNIRISHNAAAGLLTNDGDFDGDIVTVTAFDATSASGGDVSVSSDGSFVYNPPPGFEGTDTFTYTIGDGMGNFDTATVSVSVNGMIWFIDDGAAAGGDGRLTSPFNSLVSAGSFNSVAADDPNDNIFLYSGSYTGGITLLDGQALIGQGATASLSSITGITPPAGSDALPATGGTRPTISSASGNITLGSNNLIRGLDIGDSGSGTGLSGANFGILVLTEISINGTGRALNLDNGQLNPGTVDSITSTNSASHGIRLNNTSGNFTVSGTTTVTNATSEGINITNNTAALSFATTNVNSRNTTGIFFETATSGNVGFGATTIPNPNAAGGYGLRIEDSSAAFTFASLTVSDANQTSGQTDPGADFIPDTDGDGDAVFLKNNTGSFTANGGTLSNCGNDCIDIRGASNLSLSGVTISTPGLDVTGASGSGTGGHGIQAINLTGTSSITGSIIQGFNVASRDGFRLINTTSTALTMSVLGTTFQNSTGSNGILISGRNASNINFTVGGPTNNASTNCIFQNLSGAAITHNAGDTAGSTSVVNLTVRHSTFQNAPANGLNTLSARNLENAHATILIENNTFNNVARVASSNTGVITVNGDGTGASNQLSATIKSNTISNIGALSAAACGSIGNCIAYRGIQVFIDDQTKVSGTILIDDNTLTNIQRDGILFDVNNGPSGSDVNARITNNIVGTAVAPVGNGGGGQPQSGIRIIRRCKDGAIGTTCGRSANVLVSGNSVRNGNGAAGSTLNSVGLFARVEDDASMNLTVTGNDIDTNTSNSVAEIRADTNFAIGAGPSMCLDVTGNTLPAGASALIAINETAGVLNVEQASAAAVSAANSGATVTPGGTPQFGVACAAPPVAMLFDSSNRVELAAINGEEPSDFDHASSSAWMLGMERLDLLSLLKRTRSFRYADESVGLSALARETGGDGLTESTATRAALANPSAVAALSGETVNVSIGTLPAGKSVTVKFQVTVDSPVTTTQVSNQGTVTADGGINVQTDDPGTGAANDATVTPLGTPPGITCPADITTPPDSGMTTANISFSVTSTGAPAPTVECKIGTTVITSPHTFPTGTTTVNCTASNGISPDASCSFDVTVADTEAPVITCPTDIVETLPPNSTATGVVVNFAATATDNITASPTITYSKDPGTVFPLGTTTVTATATDEAGNMSSCTFDVTVQYLFDGFFSPIANLPTFNKVKAGQTVPVKFSLRGDKGLNIFAMGFPASGPIPCSSTTDANTVEETVTAGNSSLSYSPVDDKYTYTWKTLKPWKNTCRQLVIKLKDGSFHRANFMFK